MQPPKDPLPGRGSLRIGRGVTSLSIPTVAGCGSSRLGLLITCLGSTAASLKPREELCALFLKDKRQSATNHNSFHAKNTIKGCVLRSWAWEQFPPTLLQHESPGYCNCSPCGCPAEEARQNRGRKGNCSLALWKWWRIAKKRMTCGHTWTLCFPFVRIFFYLFRAVFGFFFCCCFLELPANGICWWFELKAFAAKNLLNMQIPPVCFWEAQ